MNTESLTLGTWSGVAEFVVVLWNGGTKTRACEMCGTVIERCPGGFTEVVCCKEECRSNWLFCETTRSEFGQRVRVPVRLADDEGDAAGKALQVVTVVSEHQATDAA